MNYRSMIVILLGLAGVNSVGSSQEFVLLRLNVDEGQVLHYKSTSNIESPVVSYSQVGKSQVTVQARSEDNFVLETRNYDISYQVKGGKTIDGPETRVKVTQRADGGMLGLTTDTGGDDEKFLRNPNHFSYPPYPVSVGSQWEKFVPADPVLGTPDTVISYWISGRTNWLGHDVFVVQYSNTQRAKTPMPMKGTTYVDVKSGIGVQWDAYFENWTDSNLPVKGTFHMELVPEQ